MRLIWESFHNWVRQSDENNEVVYEALEKISLLNDQDEMNENLFKSVCSDPAVAELFKLFKELCQILCDTNGTLLRFWMNSIDLVIIFLIFICASREGNWFLHLSLIKEIIPWCFAYSRINLYCYLPWCHRQMQSLPLTYPELHNC